MSGERRFGLKEAAVVAAVVGVLAVLVVGSLPGLRARERREARSAESLSCLLAGNTVDRHHIRYRFPIVIDARMKPPYPEELFCDERIAKRVTDRWTEYFPDRRVEMGDSDRGHLD